MNEIEVERYADNGEYSHSEIISLDTGEFICFVCPVCGGRWDKKDEVIYDNHTCSK